MVMLWFLKQNRRMFVLSIHALLRNIATQKTESLFADCNVKIPKQIFAVTGCYAQMDPNAVAGVEGVRLVIGNQEKMQITKYLRNLDINNSPLIVKSKISRTPFVTPDFPKIKLFKTIFQKISETIKGPGKNTENLGQEFFGK
ncbi:MAG: hypothetical protein Ct9H300mP28_15260 [Pseudomonadota bacterium]|nr:MAG: hypothetical protein Ct9H300mP28_15260 [Pseudomonadota bacterium]